MSQPLYAMTEETARRVRLLLGEQPGGGDSPRHRPRPPAAVLVRCDSATAASGSGAAAQCYPATVLLDESGATAQTDGAPVWLTVWDDAGAAATPAAGRVYPAVPAGRLAIGGDERQRAFGGTGGGSGWTGGSGDTDRATLSSSYTITANTTWEDPGLEITIPAAGDYLINVFATGYGSANSTMGILVRVWDGSAVVGPTQVVVAYNATAVPAVDQRSIGYSFMVTTTGSQTLKLQGWRTSAATWNFSLVQTYSALEYVRMV